MKTEVKVYELKFDTTKNPLGEIYLDVSINGPREKGYICEIRNLSQSKNDPDYRMFDIHGNQNFFNCRYTSNDRKDKDLFKVIPMTVKGMEQRIMDNKDQFRLWLGSYFYFNEHSLERLLERTKVVLTTRDREHKEVPLGVTVDRFGFCYSLRTADDVPLRSFDLKELKDQWDNTLKLNEGI